MIQCIVQNKSEDLKSLKKYLNEEYIMDVLKFLSSRDMREHLKKKKL